MRRKKRRLRAGLRWLFVPVCALGLLVCFAVALDRVSEGREGEDLLRLEEAARRSCVACYAVEGRYPSGVEELEERYGLQIDRTRFTVRFHAFGENLMPEITVLENDR